MHPSIEAHDRIKKYVRETPCDRSDYFSERLGCEVYFKLESLQLTGSFKLRGAFNKVLSSSEEARAKGFCTASTGNHGMACCKVFKTLGIEKGVIFVPENASDAKTSVIRKSGAQIMVHGNDAAVTETYARKWAEEQNMTFISPYNDIDIVNGQGTCGVEMAQQIGEDIDAVFVSVGGGGLISGIGRYLHSVNKNIKIVACQPENSAVMMESVKAGKIVDIPSLDTLSDGTAGGIEEGAITFEFCKDFQYVTVTEEEIVESMRNFIDGEHMMLEGSAGVAIAGLEKLKDQFQGKKCVVVICGRNVSRGVLKSIL
jgi:threonine dehydratase